MKKILLLSLLLLPSDVHADDEDTQDRKIVYKQKTEIDFESLEVEGTLLRPSSALVLERKQAAFNPLVKIRTDWNDLIEESIDEAK